MGRRSAANLVAVVVMAALLAPAGAAYGAVAAKKKSPDPCTLITSTATGALADPYTVSETSPNPSLKGNCNYYLDGTGPNEGKSEPVNLFVESLSDYKLNKSLIHKTKATKGLGVAGYTGVDGGGNTVLGFKTKKLAIRLSSDLDAPTLLALAKGINKNLK